MLNIRSALIAALSLPRLEKTEKKNSMTTLFYKCDIPDYLHSSPLYQQIVSDEPFPASGIEFPVGCVKKDMRVDRFKDVVELLHTLRYWILPDILENSIEFLMYCFDRVHLPSVAETLREFENDFPYLRDLPYIATATPPQQILAAVSLNRVSIVKYLHEVKGMLVGVKAGQVAAAKGHIGCLEYMHSVGLPLSYLLVAESIIYDQVPVLQYLLDHDAKLNSNAVVLSAYNGRLDCLKLLIERKCPLDELPEAFYLAAENGELGCIEFMWGICERGGDIFFEKYILRGATEGRQLAVFKFAVETNFPVAYYQPYLASLVEYKASDCIQYLCSVGIR